MKKTRDKILDAAESLILKQGFQATSIDKILDKVGISKGTFFYHFKNKNDLANIVLSRFSNRQNDAINRLWEKAKTETNNPLEQFESFLIKLEKSCQDPIVHRGCIIAALTQESVLNDACQTAFNNWKETLKAHINALTQNRADLNINSDELANLLITIVEGGFILNKAKSDPNQISNAIKHYRHYVTIRLS